LPAGLARQPYLSETSRTLPGIFAVSDLRGGSIKPVVSAVGDQPLYLFIYLFCNPPETIFLICNNSDIINTSVLM